MGWGDRKRIKSNKELCREVQGLSKMCYRKVTYYSEYEATIASLNAAKSLHYPMYWYKCPNCQKYHLTKTPRETQ